MLKQRDTVKKRLKTEKIKYKKKKQQSIWLNLKKNSKKTINRNPNLLN